jgi:hypothetical protein
LSKNAVWHVLLGDFILANSRGRVKRFRRAGRIKSRFQALKNHFDFTQAGAANTTRDANKNLERCLSPARFVFTSSVWSWFEMVLLLGM